MRVIMVVTREDTPHGASEARCFATLGGAEAWLTSSGFSIRTFVGSTDEPRWIRPMMYDEDAFADPDYQPEWGDNEWEVAEVFETEVGP